MNNHIHSFSPLFLAYGINSHTLFNPTLPLRSLKQLFTNTSYLHPSKTTIISIPLIHPKPTSFKFPAFLPERFLSCKDLKVPEVSTLFTSCSSLHSSPFHRSPDVSVPHCFVLPSLTPLGSCPPCCVLYFRSHMSLDNVYKKENKTFHISCRSDDENFFLIRQAVAEKNIKVLCRQTDKQTNGPQYNSLSFGEGNKNSTR